jgi:hypothetical protein
MTALYRLYSAYPLLLRWKRRGGFVGALDDYASGLAGLWSVSRRLLASYTGALVRVRRSGDNAESDFASLANGDLDVTSMVAWVVAGGGTQDGFVKTIYDQSGNSRDQNQASASRQRIIVQSGSAITLNGKAAIEATAVDTQGYITDTFTAYTDAAISAFVRGSIATVVQNRMISVTLDNGIDFAPPSRGALITSYGPGNRLLSYRDAFVSFCNFAALNTQFVASNIYTGTTCKINSGSDNSSAAFSAAFNVNQICVAGHTSTSYAAQIGDKWAEAAIYFTNKDSDDAAIRSALNV